MKKRTQRSVGDRDELIDISSLQDHPSSRPSVNDSIDTLKQIQLYNQKLPKKRKVKDALHEITTSNIVTTYTQKRDKKKKTLSVLTNYKQVGIVDGS